MKTILACAFLSLTTFTFAQTDIIEMRSRGRSLEKYERISKMTGDHVVSNFGLPPSGRPELPAFKNVILLDSVEALSDSITVMYSSEFYYDGPIFPAYEIIRYDSLGHPLETPVKRAIKPDYGEPVRTINDTVLDHWIFHRRNSLDSIKELLQKFNLFGAPENIIFIGFDNEKKNADKEEPVEYRRAEKNNGFGWELLFMILSPIVFLLGMNKLKLIKVADKP